MPPWSQCYESVIETARSLQDDTEGGGLPQMCSSREMASIARDAGDKDAFGDTRYRRRHRGEHRDTISHVVSDNPTNELRDAPMFPRRERL